MTLHVLNDLDRARLAREEAVGDTPARVALAAALEEVSDKDVQGFVLSYVTADGRSNYYAGGPGVAQARQAVGLLEDTKFSILNSRG